MRTKRLRAVFVIILILGALIVLNKVVFNVKTVSVVCANSDDQDFLTRIAEAARVRDKSIIALDENEVINNILSSVPECRVTGIERVFPDKVVINSVLRTPAVYYFYENTYYIISSDFALIKTTGTRPTNLAELRVSDAAAIDIQNTQKGHSVECQSRNFAKAAAQLLSMLWNLDGIEPGIVTIIEADTAKGEFNLSTSTGARIIIMGFDYAGDKLRLALSVYAAYPSYRYEGTIRAYRNSDGQLRAGYKK